MTASPLRATRDRLRTRPLPRRAPRRMLVVHRSGSPAEALDARVLEELRRLGHAVFDLDLARHPTALPANHDGPARLDLSPLRAVLERFAPEAVLVGGEGWEPTPATAADLRARGAALIPVAGIRGIGAASRGELLREPPPGRERILEAFQALPAPTVAGLRRDTLREWSREGTESAEEALAALAAGPLLEDVLDALVEGLPAVSGGAPAAHPVRAVVISGYYGAGNRGDELLLAVLLDRLRDAVPGFLPVVAGSQAAVVEREHGAQSFSRADLDATERHAATATGMILGPGGHWHDYSIALAGGTAGMVRGARVSPAHLAQLPLLVAAYGGQVHVAGMGVGPLTDPAAQAAVRLTGRLASSVTVRDAESAALLAPLSEDWQAPVELTPDLVYGLSLPEPAGPDARPPYLAVNLRPWEEAEEQRRGRLEAIVGAARDHGLEIVAVPMQRTDQAPLGELAETARAAGVAVEVLPPDLPLDELLSALAGARAVTAMRLHASLLAHRLHRPALGLVYDPKVGSHFAQLGRADQALALDTPPQALRAALDGVLAEEALPAHARAAVAEAEAGAQAHLDRLALALATAPERGMDPGWADHPAPAARTPASRPPAAVPAPAAPAPATPTAPPPLTPASGSDAAESVPSPAHFSQAASTRRAQALTRRAARAVRRRWKAARRRLG